MKKLLLLVALLGSATIWISAASAVTGGRLDGDAHPYAGALLARTADGGLRPACSAVLVTPRVVVTAAHCASPLAGAVAWVSFDTVLGASPRAYRGVTYRHPAFGHDMGDLHDVAVVLLDDAVADVRPASLPAAGSADGVRAVTSVGYGYNARVTGGGNPRYAYDGARRAAESQVTALSPSFLRVRTVDAGTCFGDSGGPMLVGDTVVAITSGGDASCSGMAAGYRLDTPSARAFLGPYVSG